MVGMSTIKPDEGMDTPAVWRAVMRLFEEINRSNATRNEWGYWSLSEEQTERFRSITRSGSEACIVAWQDAYRKLSSKELRKIISLPKSERHLQVVKDPEDS